MSYIRCLSNPEGLYIYGNNKHVHISHGVKYPQASRKQFPPIPQKSFDYALKKWRENSRSAIRYCGIEIKEFHVYTPSYRPVKSQNYWKRNKQSSYMIRLSYKDSYIYLWRVTMNYIAQRN